MNIVKARRVGMPSLLTAAALVLAACGGMGEEPQASSETADAPEADEECEETQSASVVLQWVAQAQFAGYYAALDNGYYADQCLDVTIQEGGTNVVPQQVLASGNAEFAVSHVAKSMASREEGADIVNISQIFQRGAYYQVAWADSGITSLADLEGTTMGSWGGGNELVLYAALRDNGIEPESDIDVVQQPFDMSLLLNREVDSVQAKPYNEYAQLLETVNPDTGELYQPEDFSVIDLQELGYASLEDGLYARDEWLNEGDNADVAARFVAASMQGWAFCRDEFDACVDIVLGHGSALGAGHQAWMLNEVNQLIWPSPDGIGTMDDAAWEQTIEIAIDGDVLGAAPDDGAYRTDINEAALAILADMDVDTTGESYEPETVEVTEGGS